ncbi:MAG: decaprenyl-phosphate phosphoribosyltransferase [Prevotella sp.]|nr:decaprenyl-phosphate phosphoribosyltransferase [Prevotella sp.]MDD7075538.1 decaprenyl-phosphate phosphoribosyltransferase [Prevotellaceae bacterium]MDY5342989.1 decaprenyl-phosphate phosphoribosyltransferase [Prevotella sp.]
MNIRHIIKVARPTHWIKNIFVFLPVFFGGALLNTTEVVAAALTFMSFSLAASAIYCLNDIIDVDADRAHPVKCKRPIASGSITIPQAYGMMTVSLLLSILLMFLLPEGHAKSILVIIAYFVINVAYCLRLKEYAIIDVCIIASGFVLRILAGGYATGVHLSKWIVLMTFLLTLFLAFAKRRDDVLRMNTTGRAPRKNTSRYNLTFINQAITITGSVMVVCYVMYTVSPEIIAQFATDKLYLTSILVILAILRYLQISVVDEKSGDPVKVALSDRATQLILLAWMLSFLIIIYL